MLAIALAAVALATTPSTNSVCPATDRTPIVSQAPGANTSLVPPGAESLIVCRYDGLPGLGLAGVGATGEESTVVQLASELDAIPPATGVYGCPADIGTALLAFFRYPSGPGDVVRVGLSGCNSLTNGHVKRLALGAPVVGELAALSHPLPPPATLTGYVKVCGGPAPGSCHIETAGYCAPHCITTARVQLLDAAGTVVATARLRHARFRLTVAQPGRYTLKLLGDGRTTRGLLFAVIHATARAGQTSRVVFLLQVP